MADLLKSFNLTLKDLESTSNEVLNRIVGELNGGDQRMAHNSQSSSSGSGHYSYVSGAGQRGAPEPADEGESER